MDSIESPSGIKLSLADPTMWKEFYPNTEMIVTKRKGRVIFPHLDYNLTGLEPNAHYEVFIHLERTHNVKYKFEAGKWREFGKGAKIFRIDYKQHPDGARPGSHWMNETVSFKHFKITNDMKNTDKQLIVLQSMHKYQPVITIKKVNDYLGEQFRLSITEFYAVTAYQCEAICKLKVSHNKHASGHKGNGRKRMSSDSESPDAKRRSLSSSSSSSSTPPSPWNQSVVTAVFNQFQNHGYPIHQHHQQVFDFAGNNPFYQQYQEWQWYPMMNPFNNGNAENSAPSGYTGLG
ncbi:hypothetical protein B9Z55_006823 [Caenorhabditis nigoni]|uniref:T-box domain-containing protein n=1 Tax=Caenorhabditis nigoni TaxID=1611254 RepID=A0A2G5V6Y1_9PELO|nr:hypothetical protein B9Z55_006823 [Caenorhabditis nigoni]